MAFVYIKQQSHSQDIYVSSHFFPTLGLLTNCGLCLQHPMTLFKTSHTSSTRICLPLGHSGHKAVLLLLQLLLVCQTMKNPTFSLFVSPTVPSAVLVLWCCTRAPQHMVCGIHSRLLHFETVVRGRDHVFWGQQCLVLEVLRVLFPTWNIALEWYSSPGVYHLWNPKIECIIFFSRNMCNFQRNLKRVCIHFLGLLEQISGLQGTFLSWHLCELGVQHWSHRPTIKVWQSCSPFWRRGEEHFLRINLFDSCTKTGY